MRKSQRQKVAQIEMKVTKGEGGGGGSRATTATMGETGTSELPCSDALVVYAVQMMQALFARQKNRYAETETSGYKRCRRLRSRRSLHFYFSYVRDIPPRHVPP